MIKKTVSLVLSVAALLSTCAFAQSTATTSVTPPPDMFAFSSETQLIENAKAAGIIDGDKTEFADTITREQFGEYLYNMINGVKELPVAKLARNPFDDAANYKINGLSFVGIVSGKGEYIFAPQDKVTREEAAVMLYRTAEYADAELPVAKTDVTYSDNAEVSPWALGAVQSLRLSGIFDDSDDAFRPKQNITEKQAIASLVKLYNILKK